MAIQENPDLPPASDIVEGEPGFIDGGRAVETSRGTEWIASGWRVFRAQPGTWILIALVLLAVLLGLAFIPVIGNLASSVLMPSFMGGLMIACRRNAKGERVEAGDLFSGLQTSPGPLLIVGLIGLLLTIVAMVPAMLMLGIGAFSGALTAMSMSMSMVIGLLLFLALLVPVQMALWFAPALVVLQRLPPGQALGQSFQACLKNILPFLLYGVLLVLLSFVATLPAFLGWLVLGPVLAASIYSAYRDIFFS